MEIEFNKLDLDNLENSKKYLFVTLKNNVIPDAARPKTLDYMKYANRLEGYIVAKQMDRDVTIFWKNIYKSFETSESSFKYRVYKGHILVKWALSSLVSEGDLDKVVKLLNKSFQEDIEFGYRNPTRRSAYKILSFLQPILESRDRLWPSDNSVRIKLARRLLIVLFTNESAIGIAFHPNKIKGEIKKCILKNDPLLNILEENVTELLGNLEVSEKNLKFSKSIMFLIGNILEGILSNLCSRAQPSLNIEKASIEKLAQILRKNHLIDVSTEYQCRLIQNYRDFIHPARNIKHKYELDVNFNKFFLLFFLFLLEDLSKASNCLGP